MNPRRDPTGLRHQDLGEVRSFAVVSDVHVRAPDDARSRALADTLDNLKPGEVDALFLLGDVFDFVYARSSFHRRHWRVAFDAMARARARGIKVYFAEGNHDFGFEHGLPDDLSRCFDAAGDVVFSLRHPALGTIWLRHGDDVVCPESYLGFRGLVKSKAFQRTTGLVPGLLTHLLFSAYARFSRTRDKYRTLEASYFRACLRRYFDALQGGPRPDVLVIGHVHVNLDSLFEGVRVISGPDWFSAPSVLIVGHEGATSRRWLTPSARAPEYPL